MKSDHLELMDFVLEKAEAAPAVRRIKLYRALARIAGDEHDEAKLNVMATDLMAAEELCREFRFSFLQQNKDEDSQSEAGGGFPTGDGPKNGNLKTPEGGK